MQPLKLVIHGKFWDSLIYRGQLYIFHLDGSIRQYDWDKAISKLAIPEAYRVAAFFAFCDSSYLYGSKWKRLFDDPDFRSLLESKFRKLDLRHPVLDPIALRKTEVTVFDNPFPFPHSDALIYGNSLFTGSSSGVFEAPVRNRSRQLKRLKVSQRTDCPVVAIDASYGALALAALDDGLRQLGVDPSSNPHEDPLLLNGATCNDCQWVYYSVFGSSHLTGGVLAQLTKPTEVYEPGVYSPLRLTERVYQATDIFKKRGYAWGSKDKLCQAANGRLQVAKYDPYTSEDAPELKIIKDIRLQSWKGLPVSGAVASFGVILELDHAIVVAQSDDQVSTFPGEAVRWRVFNRSRQYENQLHIIYEDRLEIVSFNHDYFLNQKDKTFGTFQSGFRNKY